MKKIFFIAFVTILTVGINGCKKPPLPIIEEEPANGGDSNEPSPFVGTWQYSNIDLSDGELKVMGNTVGSFEGKGSAINGKVVLTENPNEYTTELAFTADIIATFFGQSQPQQIPVDKRTSSGTWTEENGTITLNDENGNEITVLSSSKSQIVFTGDFTEQLSLGGGFNVDALANVEFTIRK